MKKLSVLCFSLLLILSLTTLVTAMEYTESPVLTEKVDKGDLEPVTERLPEDPFIVGPGTLVAEEDLDWQVGSYGGTWTSAHNAPDINSDYANLVLEPLLSAPGLSSDNIRGNILKDYEVNEDNTEFTFYMREGLKWSDGVPVTTEDFLFTYEDILMNDKLTPYFPAKYRSGGKVDGTPMKLEVIDDYTFKIIFDEPYGAFLAELTITGWVNYSDILKPKHYLKQFHAKYTPMEELKPLLEELELEDEWWSLFSSKDVLAWQMGMDKAVGFPVLYPWIGAESPSGMIVNVRNPYYHKVDIEGNQLPYIDKLESYEVSELSSITMKSLVGEMDFNRSFTALNKMPVYRSNEEKGGYKTYVLKHHCPTVLTLNPTFDDPVWREVLSDVRFRRALNYAIDRGEISESIYYGYAAPSTTIAGEYNPEKARKLLDEMGMDKIGDNGFRLSPGGKEFEVFIEVADWAPDFIPMAELLVEHFKAVGVDATMKQISSELRGQRGNANELMGTLGWLHSEIWDSQGFRDYLPGQHWPGPWGILWSTWMTTNGDSGEEPPAYIKELYQIHDNIMQVTPGTPEGQEAVDALYSWYYENVPVLLPVENVGYPVIAVENLGNVPTSGFGITANRSGEQFFFKE